MPDPYAEFQTPNADPYAEFSAPTAATTDSTPAKPSALSRFGKSYAGGVGVVSPEEGKNFFRHPIDTLTGMLESQGELGKQAGRELKSGDYVRGITHGIEYLIPGAGPQLAHAGKQLESGDIAGGVGTTLGVATVIAATPENVKGGLSKVGKLRQSVKEGVQPFARKITGTETALKEKVTATAEKHADTLAKHKTDTVATIKDNLRKQREARTNIEQEKITAAETNKGIEAKTQAEAAKVSKRAEVAKTVDEQSVALGKTLEQVESKVYKAADAKFNEVRAKIGNPEESPDELIATVKNVEKDILQDIPENIKEFRSILKMAGKESEGPLSVGGGGEVSPGEPGYEAVRQAYIQEGLIEEGKPLTWDKLQSLKSRIDARLRSRGAINGDLKRGLFSVRDSIVDEMGKMAEANGAGEAWTDAKNFWGQMREDFHEPTGPSGSGSPVAQALDAVDPQNIRKPFLAKQSTLGNRGIEILKKYPQYGGTEAATQAEALLKSHEQMKALPEKPKVTELKTSPEVHKLPTDKPIPPRPETPVVDATQVAKEAIATRAKNWGMFNARDIGILSASVIGGTIEHILSTQGGLQLPVAAFTYEGGKYATSRLLNRPGVVEWLSKTPQSEIEVLMKIPGADKIKITNGLADIAAEEGRKGKTVPLSPSARQFLGPANVARIAAASGVGQPKNRKEAIDLLSAAANQR